jgi:hypothetical protein
VQLILSEENLSKAFGLPESVDPDHEYVYRSGERGIYDFWYKDRSENYWKYTNAPTDHPDYDPYGGDAMLVNDQPMPHSAPQFYAEDGRKLHMAVPEGMELTKNEAYDPANPRSVWYGMYQSEDGEPRFVYYDADVRENLDLWVQYMLRVTDAGLVSYRKFASKLFESPHPKDRIVGCMLMLVDQGFFDAFELTQATVEDVEYIDNTVKLLNRKLVCDPGLIDFFTSLTSNRDPSEPLFVLDTTHGRNSLSPRHFYSIFKSLNISPYILLYWHASHQFSRIVHRLAAEDTPVEDVEERAYAELGRALNTVEDVTHLVDFKVKETLLRNYAPIEEPEEEAIDGEQPEAQPEEGMEEEEPVAKSLIRAPSDDFGVATIWSDLVARRPDEQEFSVWLHATPLHDISEQEQAEIEEQLSMQQEEADQPEELDTSEEGQVNTPEGAGGAPAEGDDLPSGEEQ